MARLRLTGRILLSLFMAMFVATAVLMPEAVYVGMFPTGWLYMF